MSCCALDPALTDGELIARWRLGDARALNALVRRHNEAIVGFAASRLHDRDAAKDIAQEVWMRIIRWDDLDVRGRFRALLLKMADFAVLRVKSAEKKWIAEIPSLVYTGIQHGGDFTYQAPSNLHMPGKGEKTACGVPAADDNVVTGHPRTVNCTRCKNAKEEKLRWIAELERRGMLPEAYRLKEGE